MHSPIHIFIRTLTNPLPRAQKLVACAKKLVDEVMWVGLTSLIGKQKMPGRLKEGIEARLGKKFVTVGGSSYKAGTSDSAPNIPGMEIVMPARSSSGDDSD